MAETIHGISEPYFGFLFHYYRAEVYRETNWRARLDVTTNWAIGATGAILSFTFGNENVPHTVILLNFVIVLFFLYIEARRFRYYVLLRSRTRLMERKLLAPLMSPEHALDAKDKEWLSQLSESLLRPQVQMTRVESFAWRIRRVYAILLPLLFSAWVAKTFTTPINVSTLADAWRQGGIWYIPGAFIFWMFLTIVVTLIVMAYQIPHTTLEDDLP